MCDKKMYIKIYTLLLLLVGGTNLSVHGQSRYLLVTFVPEMLHKTQFLIAKLTSLFVSLFVDRRPLLFLSYLVRQIE